MKILILWGFRKILNPRWCPYPSLIKVCLLAINVLRNEMKPQQGRVASPPPSTGNAMGLQDTIRTHRHGRDPVEFSVKGPIGISVNDERLTNTGCAVLDLIFAAPSQVGELTFRNYYTMWLSVLVKTKPNATDAENISTASLNKEDAVSEWMMSVPKKVLMQHPHYEAGSQDVISIPSSESIVEWKNLVAMRIILRQPSPVWKTFHIEEINVYKDLPRRIPNKESAAESLMLLIKRQTIVALKWVPKSDSLTQGCTGAYEFNSLPQP